MWIFTKHGFFSAVCARQGNVKHGQPVDLDRIIVRARLRSHLKALKERFDDLLGDYRIQDRPIHYQDVFATLYQQLGIDVNTVTITDPSGRPQYLLDRREPIRELV